MTASEFIRSCVAFARRHPAAVLAMPEPELAVDPRARAHHVRTVCERARNQMKTTARLCLRTASIQPDLFDSSRQRLSA
ncbi:hypothetical protein FP2506_11592 [Fulvimarina pelagi HTCC2506]|uniref:Uncharacterized protein n=1 Tax=Fulvimarina pelagi HTCC2506 TaxID=314231 RepID=Q0FYW1_9HYPH|nr:hypothetical protein [Fulvimarina pelagi]EAU40197.1 hypothetical protein FP2506_11592 [Fulvimarina pelagi HTCC2506]